MALGVGHQHGFNLLGVAEGQQMLFSQVIAAEPGCCRREHVVLQMPSQALLKPTLQGGGKVGCSLAPKLSAAPMLQRMEQGLGVRRAQSLLLQQLLHLLVGEFQKTVHALGVCPPHARDIRPATQAVL